MINLSTPSDQLKEKVSGNRYADILRAVNIIREGMVEKKAKMAKVDSGLSQVENWLAKIEDTNP